MQQQSPSPRLRVSSIYGNCLPFGVCLLIEPKTGPSVPIAESKEELAEEPGLDRSNNGETERPGK
jgi:hypothetical protein